MFKKIFASIRSFFEDPIKWDDADYGGVNNRIAYEAYNETHEPAGMKPVTSIDGKSAMLHERKANKTCVDHTVIAAQKASARNIPYMVLLFLVTDGLYHSVIKIGDDVIDIKFGEAYPYDDYLKQYGQPHGEYDVIPGHIKSLFTSLNGTFK